MKGTAGKTGGNEQKGAGRNTTLWLVVGGGGVKVTSGLERTMPQLWWSWCHGGSDIGGGVGGS
jgi:hypothetical protein